MASAVGRIVEGHGLSRAVSLVNKIGLFPVCPAPPQARTLSPTHPSYLDVIRSLAMLRLAMSENNQLKTTPPLWPSLLIAAVLAIAIPLFYFLFMDPMGFTIVLFPIHMPLLFALIWPVVVGVQGPISGGWLRRHTVAAAMFLIALVLSYYMFKLETRNAPAHQSSYVYLTPQTRTS